MLCKELFGGPWNAQNLQNSTKDLSQEQAPVAPTQAEVSSENWKCECGHENPSNAKFCNECGKPKPAGDGKLCRKCGIKNPENAKFCNNCGEEL